jgi:hypothetical protein
MRTAAPINDQNAIHIDFSDIVLQLAFEYFLPICVSDNTQRVYANSFKGAKMGVFEE